MVARRFWLLLLAIVLVCTSLVYAADKSVWPVEISDFQVSLSSSTQMQGGMGMGGMMGPSGMGMSGVSGISTRTNDQKLQFIFKSHNPSTTQTISVINWESCFMNKKQEVVIKQFKTKKKIKPTKDESIEESIFYDVKQLASPLKIGYRVNKIEFEDKTVWENPNKEKEEFIYMSIKFQ